MSEDDSTTVYTRLKELRKATADLGTHLEDPFMTLSFITLATVPKLKITDKGLVDVGMEEVVSLFV